MYAIIRTGGKQYRVAPGDVLRVEKLPQADGNIEFTEVLAASTGAQDAELSQAWLRQGSGLGGQRRARQEDPGLPLQAQKAIQEDAGSSPVLHRNQD